MASLTRYKRWQVVAYNPFVHCSQRRSVFEPGPRVGSPDWVLCSVNMQNYEPPLSAITLVCQTEVPVIPGLAAP